MKALFALVSMFFVCLAPAGQADPFRGLSTGDFANAVDVVLGTPVSDTTNAQGVRVREFVIEGGTEPEALRIVAWSDARGATLAMRTDVYRGRGEIEIGVTTVADILSMTAGRGAFDLANTIMLPADGQWEWRVTWPVAGVPREYLQLTFTADTPHPEQPSTFVPEEAILTAIMVMSMAAAGQSLDLHTLDTAEQRRTGRAVRGLLRQ